VHAAYTGQEALTFSQYIDAETGKTLRAEPGGVYEVIPASGHVVPEIPVPWFEWIEDDKAWKKMRAAFEASRQPAGEPPEGDGKTGEADGETKPEQDTKG
jgi:hypothetical protein